LGASGEFGTPPTFQCSRNDAVYWIDHLERERERATFMLSLSNSCVSEVAQIT
jgi:hypothetical protein